MIIRGIDRYRVLLLCIILLCLAATYTSISKDHALFNQDSSLYQRISFGYYEALRYPSLATPVSLYRADPVRHSIFMYFTVPLYLIFGLSDHTAIYTNLIFVAILLLSTYGIGKHLKDKNTGLLSAAILALFPATSLLSRLYLLDFPLTAAVALSIYLLLRSGAFKDRIYSVLFGISFAFGLLIKIPYIVFVFGPLVHHAYTALTQEEPSIKAAVRKNLLLSFIIGVAIPLAWYLPGARIVIGRLFYFAITFGLVSGEPYLSNLFFYFSISKLLSITFAAVFIACMCYYCVSRQRDKALLISWAVFPFLFFTFIPHKHLFYIIPVLPAVSTIIAIGLRAINKVRIKRIIISALLILGCFQYCMITYGEPVIPSKYRPLFDRMVGTGVFGIGIISEAREGDLYYKPVATRNWSRLIDEMTDAIAKSCDPARKDKVVINVLSMHAFLFDMEKRSAMLKLPLTFEYCALMPLETLETDYVIVQDGGLLAHQKSYQNNIRISRAFFERNKDRFELIGVYFLPDDPDDVKISIYKRR